MIRRPLLPADQRGRFEVSVMQGTGLMPWKPRSRKKTVCRVGHCFVNLLF